MGEVGQVGPDAYNARRVALAAGIPARSTALNVNRLCSSGLLAVLTVAVAVISGPLRAPRRERDPVAGEVDELEAAREAKYRDIRDAELDYRTGKLSREDWESVDRRLRAEAIEILDRLERARR